MSNAIIYVEVLGFIYPSDTTCSDIRPDLLLALPKNCLYSLELAVVFESNIREISHRQHIKHDDLIRQHESDFIEIKYTNILLSALEVVNQLSLSFMDILMELHYKFSTRKYSI